MKSLNRILGLLFLFILPRIPVASAVTFVIVPSGGNAPANAAGGGNLIDIVHAAARLWESAYADSVTITLYVGWAPIVDAGTHAILEQGGTPNKELAGAIFFDNSGSNRFYLDPTPNTNDEYRRRTEEYQDLGGGFVNVARVFSSPIGEAAGRTDLFSVAVHEIGHALGMCIANAFFARNLRTGAIVISDDLPFAGTVISLASNNSGFTSHFDPTAIVYGAVMAGICGDERRIPSELDILANAQISGFNFVDLNGPLAPGSRDDGAGAGPRIPVLRARN